MPPVPGKAILNRVTDRLWKRVQEAASQEEHELGTITLRFLRTLDLDTATHQAFGCGFNVWRTRNLGRISELEWSLHAKLEPASEVRRPEAGTGNMYEMPSASKPAVKKPVRSLSRKAAATDAG